MNKKIFIVGTGTDVGKTYISALITKKFQKNNKNIAYYKAAMSGNNRYIKNKLIPEDAFQVKTISGMNQPLEEMCPYVYKTAVSPHLASKIEGNPIDMDTILDTFDSICEKYDYVTVEGSGGIFCPLRFDQKIILLEDFIKARNFSTILVADAGLGTINAIMLTVEYMKIREIPLQGIIFNHYKPKNLLHEDNLSLCETLTGLKVLTKVRDGDMNLNLPFDALEKLYT